MLKLTLLWLIGEMVNTSPSQGDIQGFKSLMSHQFFYLNYYFIGNFKIVLLKFECKIMNELFT